MLEALDKKKLARLALDDARKFGVTYADVRIEAIEDQNLSLANGTVEPIDSALSIGIGIRVIKNGAWGFAATDDLREAVIREKTRLAAKIAEASAKINKTTIDLAPVKPVSAEYTSSYEIDPFLVPMDEKIAFLQDIDKAIIDVSFDGMNSRNVFASFRRRDKYFASSEGADISQLLIQTGSGLSMGLAKSHRERYERSFPSSSGQYECKGYELLEELKLKDNIPRLAEELKMLLAAENCPQKKSTLLLSGDQVSLQMHESIGHPLELDRVFGAERDFSGTSFATPDKLGNLKYASDIVTVVCDSTAPHGLATYGYDDEGVPARPVPLIKDGILVDYLSSRETAARIGHESTACMRANSWINVPIVRIAGINLIPGNTSFEQLLSEIDDGIFMDTVRSWSIDDERRYFQFGCEIGWLIKGGKLTTPIKNPTYSGCTTEFWNSCSGIADKDSWRIWGTPNCGKGQPGQNARTAQGASPCRFDNVEIGTGS
jgi:TldD protein